jgi:hypothetical protein
MEYINTNRYWQFRIHSINAVKLFVLKMEVFYFYSFICLTLNFTFDTFTFYFYLKRKIEWFQIVPTYLPWSNFPSWAYPPIVTSFPLPWYLFLANSPSYTYLRTGLLFSTYLIDFPHPNFTPSSHSPMYCSSILYALSLV